MTAGTLHFATYFDRHYLTRGLALYRSLVRHSPPFVLWVLCLDDETYHTLTRLRLDHVNLVRLSELERADPALLEVKPSRQPVEYYWTCGPAFLVYLLERCCRVDMLSYLDADLYFYGDPTPIYDELADGSILVVGQRCSARASALTRQKGTYNVGLLAFRRRPDAVACLGRWREQCLDWCFNRVEPTRFGDQKYLDEWPSHFAGLVVLQHKGAGLAPYNLGNYRYSYETGRVLVDGQPLVFYHFNYRLRVISRWLYDPGLWRTGEKLDPIVRRHIYVPYLRELRAAAELIRGAGGRVHPVDNLLYGRNRLLSLARVAWHRSFLVVTDSFAL